MRVALSIMLMQECCNFICQWENEPGGVPIRIKHLLHSPYLTLTRVISLIYRMSYVGCHVLHSIITACPSLALPTLFPFFGAGERV